MTKWTSEIVANIAQVVLYVLWNDAKQGGCRTLPLQAESNNNINSINNINDMNSHTKIITSMTSIVTKIITSMTSIVAKIITSMTSTQ